MGDDERLRHSLRTKLAELVGSDEAGLVMEQLPPVPWTELATKDDVTSLGAELRGEMAELRSELRGEMAELRSELRGSAGDLRGEMAGLESRLTTAMRTQLIAIIGAIATMQGLTVAALL